MNLIEVKVCGYGVELRIDKRKLGLNALELQHFLDSLVQIDVVREYLGLDEEGEEEVEADEKPDQLGATETKQFQEFCRALAVTMDLAADVRGILAHFVPDAS